MSELKSRRVYVRREHEFSVDIQAESLEVALAKAKSMTISDLLAHSTMTTYEVKHEITGVVD